MRLHPLALCGGLLLAAMAPTHARSMAADTIHGRVHDSAGRPVARAEVELVEAGTVTITDRDGNLPLPVPDMLI